MSISIEEAADFVRTSFESFKANVKLVKDLGYNIEFKQQGDSYYTHYASMDTVLHSYLKITKEISI